MPYFAAQRLQYVAKLGVVSDGEICTVGTGIVSSGTASGTYVLTGTGTQVVSSLSSYSAFRTNPVHAATGYWSVPMRDSAFKVIQANVQPISTGQPSALSPLLVQMQPPTADANGKLVLNWVFLNTSGLPTDIPVGGQFCVFVEYGETSF